jgi:hypothetical protein
MKIFYYCYGSAHSSVVAAGIHLGLLPLDRIPTESCFEKLPHYDETRSDEIGTPFFMGLDEYNIEIYIIGMASERKLIKNAILSLLSICGIDKKQIMLVNALKGVNMKTRFGGFASRRLGLVKWGRPFTIKGIQENYNSFIQLVTEVKQKEKSYLNIT